MPVWYWELQVKQPHTCPLSDCGSASSTPAPALPTPDGS